MSHWLLSILSFSSTWARFSSFLSSFFTTFSAAFLFSSTTSTELDTSSSTKVLTTCSAAFFSFSANFCFFSASFTDFLFIGVSLGISLAVGFLFTLTVVGFLTFFFVPLLLPFFFLSKIFRVLRASFSSLRFSSSVFLALPFAFASPSAFASAPSFRPCTSSSGKLLAAFSAADIFGLFGTFQLNTALSMRPPFSHSSQGLKSFCFSLSSCSSKASPGIRFLTGAADLSAFGCPVMCLAKAQLA